jgi:ribonuclease P protein component
MTPPTGEGFPKATRIRRRREFLSLGRKGSRWSAPHFVVLARARSGASRLGVTVSRKVGGAVTRNRLKRRIREVFRRFPGRSRLAHDLVVIAKPGAGSLTTSEISREFGAAVERQV